MQQLLNTFKKTQSQNNSPVLALCLGTVFTLLCSAAFAAKVTSVSPETFAQYGKENAFWEASVSCENSATARIIQRKTDGDEWCPKGANNLCNSNKDTAAANACGDSYTDVIEQETAAKEQEKQAQIARERAREAELQRQRIAAAAAPKPKPRPTISAEEAKLRNKISIQEARIKLDQTKLELRRKELSLERRALEIEEILETLE